MHRQLQSLVPVLGILDGVSRRYVLLQVTLLIKPSHTLLQQLLRATLEEEAFHFGDRSYRRIIVLIVRLPKGVSCRVRDALLELVILLFHDLSQYRRVFVLSTASLGFGRQSFNFVLEHRVAKCKATHSDLRFDHGFVRKEFGSGVSGQNFRLLLLFEFME